MFANQNPFYFATIRKITVAFGTLFNNIRVVRHEFSGGVGDELKTIKVPLSYASGSKWYVHRRQDVPAQSTIQTKVSLPRIGFELTGLEYDADRKVNTLNNTVKTDETNPDSFFRQLNPSPYNFSFDVHIAVKNMDDGLQIVEQILPYFQPSYTLNIKDIPELAISKDVKVVFAGIGLTDDYEGSFDDDRILIWTLSFVVKGYLYPAIGDAEVIKKVITNFYKDEEMTVKSNVVTVKVDPIDSAFDDDWEDVTTIFDESDLDSNGDPIEDSNSG